MKRSFLLGAVLGALTAGTSTAWALSCMSNYEEADLEIVSVTVDGVALEDLSAYDGATRIEAGHEHVQVVWERDDAYAYESYVPEVQ